VARLAPRAGQGGEARRLIASIEHSPIATVVTDPRQADNPIVAANAAFAQLTGYPVGEVIGRNCRFLAGPETDRAAQARLRQAVAQARPALVELINYRKEGTAFTNAVMIAPLFDDDGALSLFVGSQMRVATPHGAGEPRRRARQLVEGLTRRQRQVLEQLVRGRRNKQIGGELGIAEKTVKLHRARMMAALGAPTSADAIRIGVEAGLPGGA
jgi:PAS domain S-box-containing protein